MLRHRLVLAAGFFLALGGLRLARCQAPGPAGGGKDQSAQPAPAPSAIFRSEANLVLVDAVVTDKKKHYIKDLAQKEFHLFEDGLEQSIVSFYREADIKPGTPGQERYLVLFFDNTAIAPENLLEEREAATKFVEMTASPNRMMAVVDFRDGLHVGQNFTANSDLLENAIKGVRSSAIQSSAVQESATPFHDIGSSADRKEHGFATPDLFLAIRGIADLLSTVPGRKVMIFLSAGFELNSDRQANLLATVDALNKANIGVYPVSALGLPASAGSAPGGRGLSATAMPASVRASDQGLYYLASHTGGFPIVDANNLTRGMQRVAEEMQESYILGYIPPNPAHDGSYHKIQVKVDRAGAEVRTRDGYFDMKSPDPLRGKPEAKTLEARATSSEPGEIPVTLSAPYFYVQPGVAMVNLALSIPGASFEFEKQKGAFHSHLDILGIADRDDGSVAARFSDTVALDYDEEQVQQIAKGPFEYQKCFKITPGTYMLKVALSAGGQRLGKYVLPLVVDSFSGKEFTLGGPALGDRIVTLTPQTEDMDEALLENSKPLVANGMQVVPSASNRFAKNAQPVVYVEVYDPLLKASPLQVGILFKIVDRSTNHLLYSSNTIPIRQPLRPGSPLIPVSFNLPIDQLPAGHYEIEVWARDSDGNMSAVKGSDFSVE